MRKNARPGQLLLAETVTCVTNRYRFPRARLPNRLRRSAARTEGRAEARRLPRTRAGGLGPAESCPVRSPVSARMFTESEVESYYPARCRVQWH